MMNGGGLERGVGAVMDASDILRNTKMSVNATNSVTMLLGGRVSFYSGLRMNHLNPHGAKNTILHSHFQIPFQIRHGTICHFSLHLMHSTTCCSTHSLHIPYNNNHEPTVSLDPLLLPFVSPSPRRHLRPAITIPNLDSDDQLAPRPTNIFAIEPFPAYVAHCNGVFPAKFLASSGAARSSNILTI